MIPERERPSLTSEERDLAALVESIHDPAHDDNRFGPGLIYDDVLDETDRPILFEVDPGADLDEDRS